MLGFFDRGAAFELKLILVEINFEFLDFCNFRFLYRHFQILKNFVETNFDFSGLC